ncbi:MAG: pyridoxal-dependent decarboxylase [Pseudanabaenaceae cyanobacterium SKYGB_i_bin29]|nr:pyridoxal-dependent decarboxylase [Pseudanabaenaceae cyanobacterium SKYG29]MDW8422544.1 pyridoxal-dependent decarboxylase [Pseudanabaenaceae cyanobacterium SKYGB_i_bin29]
MKDQFLLPDHSNRDALRQIGYAFVDLIIDRVLAQQGGDFVAKTADFLLNVPELGNSLAEILSVLQKDILPRTINLHHQGYMGHMDSVPLAITIWADALISAINNNMLSKELSPIFTELEGKLLNWFGQQFGLPAACFGTLTAGGSLANITALFLARNHHDRSICQRGNQKPLYAFVSEAAHTSFDKAMNVLGLGKNHLIKIPTNYRGEILVDCLESEIEKVVGEGGIPFVIIAVAGTTVTGAIDSIHDLADIAKKYNCWFHVDCAYGGAVIFSQTWRHLLRGTDRADSITFNPQKWLGIARTCAMLLVRNRETLETAFAQDLPYMNDHDLNFGNLTLQGTRRTDILKLWLALQTMGRKGWESYIDRSFVLRQEFCQIIDRSPRVRLALEPTLNIVCFDSTDPQTTNRELQQELQQKQQYWFSLPQWQGKELLKAVLLHPYPNLTDIL